MAIPLVTLTDILGATDVLQQKETTDKTMLEAIGTPNVDVLRSKLVQWALQGFPNVYILMELTIAPPATCSDGQTRSLAEYVEFCSGKPMYHHVSILQSQLPDFVIGFVNMGSSIQIVVSKKD